MSAGRPRSRPGARASPGGGGRACPRRGGRSGPRARRRCGPSRARRAATSTSPSSRAAPIASEASPSAAAAASSSRASGGLGVALGRAQLRGEGAERLPPAGDSGAQVGLAGDAIASVRAPSRSWAARSAVSSPQTAVRSRSRAASFSSIAERRWRSACSSSASAFSRSARAVLGRLLGRGEVAAAAWRAGRRAAAGCSSPRLLLEAGVGLGGVRLPAQRPQAGARLALDVEGAVEVGAGPLELELRAAAALAVLAEAGGLLDQHAALARLARARSPRPCPGR